MLSSTEVLSAQAAYDALAPHYDAFTAGYAHDAWFDSIHDRAKRLDLTGSRALDLACGTGKSTELLFLAGYEVRACDISPRMVELARLKLPTISENIFVADMRALPDLPEVDLVLCLDDAINYLVSPDDLAATFQGAARTLRPGGLLIFDVNTLATFRTAFSQTFVRQTPDRFFAWQGQASAEIDEGCLAVAEIEAFTRRPDATWARATSRHEQRHHPRSVVEATLHQAGLTCCHVDGQRRGGILEPHPHDLQHIKFVYYARRDEQRETV